MPSVGIVFRASTFCRCRSTKSHIITKSSIWQQRNEIRPRVRNRKTTTGKTLLVRNPDSGQVEAGFQVWVTKGGSPRGAYRAASCEEPSSVLSVPEQQCRSGFHPRFQIPEDNPIQFQFLKVPVFPSARSSHRWASSSAIRRARRAGRRITKYVVNTAELEQVKYDKVEIPRAELQELGIDFDALPQRTQRSLMLGLPTRELFPATVQAFEPRHDDGSFQPEFLPGS